MSSDDNPETQPRPIFFREHPMSSDDNPDTQPPPLRGPRSLNASPRGNLPTSAPVLPPLRSLGTRRLSAMSPSNNHRAPARATGRTVEPLQSRYSDRPNFDLADTLYDPYFQAFFQDAEDISDPESHDSPPAETQRPTYRGYSPVFGTEDENHSRLRALLDYTHSASPTLPDLFSTFTPPQRHEPPEESRRAKRRKLDSDRLCSNFRGFQYGKYGQVQPGHLTMELVSCDGGIYLDDTTKYDVKNILRNDHDVYCTEGPRCNIVLRHQGATAFTLKELVIKAPRSNFTSPVQAGMVFISMTHDHLLNRTAQYQIQYSPTRSARRERDLPLNPIVSIRHNEDGSTMTRAQVRARRLYNMGLDDEDNDSCLAQIPSEFTVCPPPCQVTIECSNDEEEEESDDLNMRLNGQTPNRIGSLPFENDSSDDDEGPDNLSADGTDYRSRRRWNRPRTALAEAAEAAQIATQEAVRAVGGELMTPSARFYIEPHKSTCTIRFNPPISGRFILLKMWNPRRSANANIDIQAVIAKGFAGPRFFPSIELR